jgi:hypothetical protein
VSFVTLMILCLYYFSQPDKVNRYDSVSDFDFYLIQFLFPDNLAHALAYTSVLSVTEATACLSTA